MLKKINNVIWDWNGTLIDDMKISLATLNEALIKNGKQTVDVKYYRENFTFPVRDFYLKVGLTFSKNEFERYSAVFMESYLEKSKHVSLHPAAITLLKFFREKGVRQYVLSAMEQSMLEDMIRDFGIAEYFDGIQGLENMHAHSKAGAGKKLIGETGANGISTVMIGDTLHDFEVAGEIGISCFLLSCGHYTRSRLETVKVPVFSDHTGLLKYIQQNNL